MSGVPLLGIEQASCLRGGRLLFEGLDLRLAKGEALVVGGANGTGKSSLLRLAAGLLRPAAGKIVRGTAFSLADDALALDPRLGLAKALGFWAGLDGGEAARGIDAMGLSPLADTPVRLLSSGQRKRATLARVIASNAPLWLLDEPANALDDDGLKLLGDAMQAHLGSGGAILAASHQPLALPGARQLALGPA